MNKKYKIQNPNTQPNIPTDSVNKLQQNKKRTAELIAASKNLILQRKERENRNLELAAELRVEICNLNKQFNQKLVTRDNQYTFLIQVNQAIIHDTNEEMLFQHLCRIAIQFGGFKMAWIAGVDTVHKKIMLLNHTGISSEDLDFFNDASCKANSPEGHILKTDTAFICNDIDKVALFDSGKSFLKKYGIQSCIILPIKKSGKIYAFLNMYADKVDFFENNDIVLLTEAANDISFGLDIFEKEKKHKRAEILLKKSEEFNRGILNSLNSHIAVINSSGKIIAVNEGWKRFAAENGARNLQTVSIGTNYFGECENAVRRGDDAADEVIRGMKSVLEGKQRVFYFEYPCHSPAQKRWFGMKAIKFEGNTPMLVVSHVNISERKLAEENLTKSEARLKEAQTIAHTGNWEVDLETNILTWSDEIYNILDIDKTVPPSSELFLSLIHSEDRKKIIKNLKKPSASRETSSTEFRFIRNDGIIRNGCIERKMEFDENKKMIRLYGIMQDITERKASGEVREKLTEDLIQRNRELEQFTFMLSHDLRAPTANIMGFSENLQDENLSADDQKQCLMGLSMSVERLDSIIKDINTIVKLKGDVDEKKKPVHFSKLVRDIIEGMQNVIKENNINILTDFSSINEINSIRIYFHSIFFNLISNSIKYRNTQVQSLIEIKSKNENEMVTITFQDNGLGLDLKAKEGIFGLYKRFHTHTEGKGMGLFMVKTQVESLGGVIKVESEVNKGTRFTVVFPKQLITKE